MSGVTKQSEIVTAAQELFNRFGFEKTTMTDIAKRLGISKASLYYYFDDKESIIRSLALKEQEQFVDELESIIADSSSTKERLLAYSNKRVDLLQKRLTLSSSNLITHHSMKSIFSTILTELKDQEEQLVHEILAIGVADGEIENVDIQEHTVLYLNILKGLRHNAFYNVDKIELLHLSDDDIALVQKQSKQFTEIFYNGISK